MTLLLVFANREFGANMYSICSDGGASTSSRTKVAMIGIPSAAEWSASRLRLQAFTSLPLSFLRLIGLVLYWVRSKFAATPRAKARVWSERRYQYGPQVCSRKR